MAQSVIFHRNLGPTSCHEQSQDVRWPDKPAKEGPPWTPFIVTLSHKKPAQGVIAHSARNLILGLGNAIQWMREGPVGYAA
jgi:hypothetical protein